MNKAMRYAIYYTPPPTHPLTIAGARWLGCNAFTGEQFEHPMFNQIPADKFAARTAFSRRYGFHGTIVAPFRAGEGVNEEVIAENLHRFCKKQQPFELNGLFVGKLHRFLALQNRSESEQLGTIAAQAVEHFHCLRAPPSVEEVRKRESNKLTRRQRDLMDRWGYPYVMDEFHFHMTLAGPLEPEEHERFGGAARRFFAPVLSDTVPFDGLALFVEPEPGGDFLVRKYVTFGSAR